MKDKDNAILFSKIDMEDYWVCGGIVFKVENSGTYQEAYNEVKDKLETSEMVDFIIKENCLLDDLFDGDESFKFVKTYWASALHFVFKNDDEYEVEYKMSADFVKLC